MTLLIALISILIGAQTQYNRADYLTASGWTKARKTVLNNKVSPNGTVVCTYGGESVLEHNIDIDHVVPLKYAHEHGVGDSSRVFKRKLGLDTANMLPVCAHENRSKGDDGPAAFMPTQNACLYARKWSEITKIYKIKMDKADKDVIKATLKSCKEVK